MARREFAKGFDGYLQSVEQCYKENTRLFIYFTGEKNDKGISWCPDCNDAEPSVKQALEQYTSKDDVFLTVDVGDRTFWKDMKNPFRGDSNIKLMVIPTIIRWKSVLRLEGEQCNKNELLEMFFEEE